MPTSVNDVIFAVLYDLDDKNVRQRVDKKVVQLKHPALAELIGKVSSQKDVSFNFQGDIIGQIRREMIRRCSMLYESLTGDEGPHDFGTIERKFHPLLKSLKEDVQENITLDKEICNSMNQLYKLTLEEMKSKERYVQEVELSMVKMKWERALLKNTFFKCQIIMMDKRVNDCKSDLVCIDSSAQGVIKRRNQVKVMNEQLMALKDQVTKKTARWEAIQRDVPQDVIEEFVKTKKMLDEKKWAYKQLMDLSPTK